MPESALKSALAAPVEMEPVGWGPEQSAELYRLDAWGDEFFVINEQGHAAVRPFGDERLSIDIVRLVHELERRQEPFPLLVRF